MAAWTTRERTALLACLGAAAAILVLAIGYAGRDENPNPRLVYEACVEAVEDQLSAASGVDAEPFDEASVEGQGGSRYRVEIDVLASAEDGDIINGRWRCVMEPHPDGGWRLVEPLERA